MAEHADFLVEVGTEELPPRALPALEAALRDGLVARLAEARLGHGEVESFATPRRLAVKVRRLETRQADQQVELRGPPASVARADGGWTRAAEKFAASAGVAVEALVEKAEGKGVYVYAHKTEHGAAAAALLPGLVESALAALPVPRRMRWGAASAEFVRPVHWLVMLLGKDVVPCTLFGIAAGRLTRGHRFMAPAGIKLAGPEDYLARLESEGFVVASFADRRQRIAAQAETAAGEHGARLVLDPALLDEVTALVEWPVPVTGEFEERFLALPEEVLIATLQDHQRYFPTRGPDGRLTARFITISNLDSPDPRAIRRGNERVVRPRLADAAFFWTQDRRSPLKARTALLDSVVFQKKLGSVGDKSRRVAALAAHIAESLGGDAEAAKLAGALAKCDLVTAMVGEFPELQGTMGRYYALADGHPEEVAHAIEEQYLPRFAGDRLPATRTGQALALAEKLDTIAGIFAIGQRPTGNRDPFGIRRAALGVLRWSPAQSRSSPKRARTARPRLPTSCSSGCAAITSRAAARWSRRTTPSRRCWPVARRRWWTSTSAWPPSWNSRDWMLRPRWPPPTSASPTSCGRRTRSNPTTCGPSCCARLPSATCSNRWPRWRTKWRRWSPRENIARPSSGSPRCARRWIASSTTSW